MKIKISRFHGFNYPSGPSCVFMDSHERWWLHNTQDRKLCCLRISHAYIIYVYYTTNHTQLPGENNIIFHQFSSYVCLYTVPGKHRWDNGGWSRLPGHTFVFKHTRNIDSWSIVIIFNLQPSYFTQIINLI